jgi:hypothetical protein
MQNLYTEQMFFTLAFPGTSTENTNIVRPPQRYSSLGTFIKLYQFISCFNIFTEQNIVAEIVGYH